MLRKISPGNWNYIKVVQNKNEIITFKKPTPEYSFDVVGLWQNGSPRPPHHRHRTLLPWHQALPRRPKVTDRLLVRNGATVFCCLRLWIPSPELLFPWNKRELSCRSVWVSEGPNGFRLFCDYVVNLNLVGPEPTGSLRAEELPLR